MGGAKTMSKMYTNRLSSTRRNHTVASQRITRSNLLTLRAAEMKEDNVRKIWSSVVNEIKSAFSSLFAAKQEKANSMCKYYGHVIRGNTWQGYLPKCADCGETISAPDQLRKAQANT